MNESWNLPAKSLLAMPSDDAHLMVGKKNSVTTVLREVQPSLIGVDCGRHLISFATQKGASCLPVNVGESLVNILFYLENSSKWKCHLNELQTMHDVEVSSVFTDMLAVFVEMFEEAARPVQAT